MKKLEPAGHLAPYGVMAHADTRNVFAAISAHGGRARFVGGIVRDALLGRDLHDVDVACDLPPEETSVALEKAGIKVIPTGIAHGTVTAVSGDHSYEITTLRVDVQTDGRHAEVAFTDNWFADAQRRDFTFNAMYCDLEGTIYDPFDGQTDLRDGKVRFIGVAEDRIAEDYLRIMRFFRFQALYGRPPLDPAGANACRAGAAGLHDISPERIRDELFKLMRAPHPAVTISEMIGYGVLPEILPDLKDVGRLRVIEWLESTALDDPAIKPDPLRRLAALYVSAGDGPAANAHAASFARNLRLSGAEIERFTLMSASWRAIRNTMEPETVRRTLYQLGADAFRDAVLLAWAAKRAVSERPAPGENKRWQTLLAAAGQWRDVELPLRGRDILAARLVPAGPQVGELLKNAENYWLDRDMRPEHDELLAYVKSLVSLPDQEMK
jgi:poly(A) polymerase